MNAPSARRRASTFRRVGWLAVAAMATLALVGPAAGPVGAADPITPLVYTSVDHPSLADNPICAVLDSEFGGSQSWNAGGEVKSDPPASETLDVAGFGTITTSWNSGTQTFSWTSTFGIDAVLFKTGQGNGGYNTLFVYAPTAASVEAFAGSGTNGSATGLSHVSFCFDADDPPTEPPTSPPTEPPTPPPGPTPESAELVVLKWLDIDGDPTTPDDILPGSGWTFDVTVTGGSVAPPSGTTVLDDQGTEDLADDLAYVVFDLVLDSEGITADVSEVAQADNDFVEAFCYDLDSEAERGTPGIGVVTGVEILAGETVVCEFFNTSGEEAGATATPRTTAPPTDALPITGTPGGAGWSIALLAIAGLLATLLLVPSPATVRRRR